MSRLSRTVRAEPPFLAKWKDTKACCQWCGVALPHGRRKWCGESCILRKKIACGYQGAARSWLEWGGKEPFVGDPVCPFLCALCSADISYAAWEADHIVPLVEGGARAPENLRALCVRCHKKETMALRKRLAARRQRAAEMMFTEEPTQ